MAFKDLFFKTEAPEEESTYDTSESFEEYDEEPVINFETDEVESTGAAFGFGAKSIAELYENGGMADLSKSIFKVEEIKAVVPEELAGSVKKKTVLGMLKISGLESEALIEDARKRLELLNKGRKSFDKSMKALADEDLGKIRQLEAEIEKLKSNMKEVSTTLALQNSTIDAEISKINNIISFIGGK